LDKKCNKLKSFDFGVITYNQQDVVIETLESIKYLVENYGVGIDCRLIIGDDGSKDKTVELCKKWVAANEGWFSLAVVLEPEGNKGTVQNYLNVFRLITSSHFKIMDGDDIFSSNNLFELYEKLPENEIFTCVPMGIDEKGKYRDVTNDYCFFSKQDNSKRIGIMKYQNIFLSGSTFIRREMITYSTIEFMKRFRLLEDHSMYYEIIMRTKPNIRYFSTPYIIYRVRDISVSHSKTISMTYAEDCIKMCQYMLGKADNLYAQAHLRLALLSYKIRFVYLQPMKYIGKIVVWIRKHSVKDSEKILLQSDIINELNHYKHIQEKAALFVEVCKIE